LILAVACVTGLKCCDFQRLPAHGSEKRVDDTNGSGRHCDWCTLRKASADCIGDCLLPSFDKFRMRQSAWPPMKLFRTISSLEQCWMTTIY